MLIVSASRVQVGSQLNMASGAVDEDRRGASRRATSFPAREYGPRTPLTTTPMRPTRRQLDAGTAPTPQRGRMGASLEALGAGRLAGDVSCMFGRSQTGELGVVTFNKTSRLSEAGLNIGVGRPPTPRYSGLMSCLMRCGAIK